MDPTGGATVVEVASINAFTLEMTRDFVDVTCFGDTEKQSVAGLRDIGGSYKGCYDKASYMVIFDAIGGAVAVMLHLVPDLVDPTYLWKGLAYLDGSIDCSASGAVTHEGKFKGAGPWVMEP
jgi:hypothetical protein